MLCYSDTSEWKRVRTRLTLSPVTTIFDTWKWFFKSRVHIKYMSDHLCTELMQLFMKVLFMGFCSEQTVCSLNNYWHSSGVAHHSYLIVVDGRRWQTCPQVILISGSIKDLCCHLIVICSARICLCVCFVHMFVIGYKKFIFQIFKVFSSSQKFYRFHPIQKNQILLADSALCPISCIVIEFWFDILWLCGTDERLVFITYLNYVVDPILTPSAVKVPVKCCNTSWLTDWCDWCHWLVQCEGLSCF
jgi:hypothetical protein